MSTLNMLRLQHVSPTVEFDDSELCFLSCLEGIGSWMNVKERLSKISE